MTNFQKITAVDGKTGNPYYPSHCRIQAAYRMLMSAVWHIKTSDHDAEHVLRSVAKLHTRIA